MGVNLDAILMSILKIVGAFAIVTSLTWICIEIWWEIFERTKIAKIALEYIKTHRMEFESWYLQKYGGRDEHD